jgi:hypothetical protein
LENHDSVLRGDLKGFDPSYAIRLKSTTKLDWVGTQIYEEFWNNVIIIELFS